MIDDQQFTRSPAFDLTAVEQLDPSQKADRVRLHRELLTAMFVLVKNGLLFDENNPTLLNSCDRMAAVMNIVHRHNEGLAAVQFLSDGVYVNRQLLRLDTQTYERGEYLYTVWRSFGVGELAAHEETGRADWLEVVGELRHCISSGAGDDALRDRMFRRIKLSPLEHVHHGSSDAGGARLRALRAYSIASLVTGEMLDGIRAGNRPRIVDLKRALQELISVAPTCTDLLLGLLHQKRHKASLANHLVNTATLVVCLTTNFGMTRKALTELCLQACLHDIGRIFDGADSTNDPRLVHARRALDSVCSLLRMTAQQDARMGRVIAANETRLWAHGDPSANEYPYPASSAARIIAVAHAYDLLTTATGQRPALLPDEALRLIMTEAGRRYDAAAVRLLVDAIGIFPLGSVVSLTTGELAIVVRIGQGEDSWASPTVKVIRGQSGLLVSNGPVLDMASTQGDRRIQGCIDPEHEGINVSAFLLD